MLTSVVRIEDNEVVLWCFSFRVSRFFMLILSWNVKGLGRREKRMLIRNLIRKFKSTILFLPEMKLGVFDSGIVNYLVGGWLSRGIGMEAQGST